MSENEARRRVGPGWLILIAALAVPGFLFYNWSRSMKAEHERALTSKAMGRASEGSLFATPPSGGRLVNPIARNAAAPAVRVSTVAAVRASTAPAAVVASRPSPVPATALAAAAATAARAVPSASGNVAASTAAVALSSAAVTLSRDPFVSPLDLVRQREAAAERERQRLLALEAAHPAPVHHVRPVERKIEQDVDLQGVITTPDGSARVIVNNETLSKGDTFKAPGHSGRVTVVEITSDTVWFVYKNRRFKKVISSE